MLDSRVHVQGDCHLLNFGNHPVKHEEFYTLFSAIRRKSSTARPTFPVNRDIYPLTFPQQKREQMDELCAWPEGDPALGCARSVVQSDLI